MDEPPPHPPATQRRRGREPSRRPREPDALEKGLRFGCGALLGGLLVASVVFFEFVDLSGDAGRLWMIVGVCALASGVFAMRFGDRAFEVLFSLFPWL